MTPGIHHALPWDNYRLTPAVSASALKHFARSGLHYWHAIGEPLARAQTGEDVPDDPGTESQRLGRLIHAAILEPESVRVRYAQDAAIPRQTGYKEAQAMHRTRQLALRASVGLPAPLEWITPAMADAAGACAAAVASHKLARTLLRRQSGHAEVSIAWVSEDGIACKGRPDFVRHGLKIGDEPRTVIVDLKSTNDASPEAFGRQAAQYGYHLQAAWYLDGYAAALAQSGSSEPAPSASYIVAVETEAPFAVAVYEVPEQALELGRQQYRRHLDTYTQQLRAGRWVGYPETEAIPLTLPVWAFRQEPTE